MVDRTTSEAWYELSSLVDAAYGLACLADYQCHEGLGIKEELEAAQRAPMTAARLLLERAKELVCLVEPRASGA